MKRSKVLGAVWILLALVMCVILLASLIGGKNFMFGLFKSKGSDVALKNVPASESTFFAPSEISSIDVDVSSHSVFLERKDVKNIAVILDGNEKRWPSVYITNGVLKIVDERKFSLFDGFSTHKIIIELPNSFEPSELDLKNSSGSLSMVNIKTPSIDCSCSSGSVSLENCESNDVDLKCSSGSIKIAGSTIKTLDCKSSSGSIKLEGSFDSIDANVTSGSIKAELKSPLKERSSLKSVSGSLHLSVPDESSLGIKYSTTSGTYKNSKTGVSGGKSGTDRIGNGDIELELKATSGSIRVE